MSHSHTHGYSFQIVGTIVVHFMTEEARSKYELEKLWTLGPHYDEQYRNMEHVLENNP